MSKMIYCNCPKCLGQVYNYIREGAKEYRTMHCYNCDIKFKVNIKDFIEKSRS